MGRAARWLAAAAFAAFLNAFCSAPAAAESPVLDVYVPAVDYPAELPPETRQPGAELRSQPAEDGSASDGAGGRREGTFRGKLGWRLQ